MNTISTMHGDLRLPAFLPDATRAVVRALDARDVAACGIQALMVNALHLSTNPGASVIAALGGVHRFMGWNTPIASDSGGFQAYSLASSARKLGSVSEDGFTYRFDASQEKKHLTPEKCIQKQFRIASDIMFCLDHCTHPNADTRVQRESVEHTVTWAQRCKTEFERRINERESGARPLLFAVVQGGADPELRRECSERLIEIGFDGFGFGGWPIDENGALVDMVECVAKLIPSSFPKHALGIGKPENVVRAYKLGYRLFDCALPTRDARHKRLFAFQTGSAAIVDSAEFYTCVYLQDERHARNRAPVDESCDCLACQHYSCAYLHHLFRIEDPLAFRLATIHNLRFYSRLMERLAAVEQ